MACSRRERDLVEVAVVAMRRERVRERGDEPGLGRADRSPAPTTGRGSGAFRPGDRSAARSARPGGRRRGSAGRSSPSAASRPGRRPPRRSRSRRAGAAGRDPSTADRAARGRRRPGSTPPGGDPIARPRAPPGRGSARSSATTNRSPRSPSTATGTSRPASMSSARTRGAIRRVARSRRPTAPGCPRRRAGRAPRYRARSRWSCCSSLGAALGEDLGREQPLGEVVDAEVALAPGDAERADLGERLEDRPHLVRRAPVPVDRLARPDVPRLERALVADPLEELLDERRVVVERAAPRGAGAIRSQM